MSQFTQLIASEPIITPPVEQIEWDKRWIDTMTITSPLVNKVSIYIKIVPARDLPDGEKELKPHLENSDVTVLQIDNMWEIIGTNPKFAMAFELILEAVNNYGISQGVFKSDVVPVLPSEEPIIEPEIPVEPTLEITN